MNAQQRISIGIATVLALLSSPMALAGKIAKMDGKKVMINLEGDAAKEGDIFVVWDPNGKKKALVKIKQVRGDRAIGILGKGMAQPGWMIKISDKVSKPNRTRPAVADGSRGRSQWGFMAGIVQDSVKVKIDNDTNGSRETTVSMSGMGYSVKGVFDYNLFSMFWFRGMGGLEGFNASGGTGAPAGCNNKKCSVSIYYLSADMWGRLVVPIAGDSKLWGGVGFTVMFPATKSATAIEESSITNTSAISGGGGIDWALSPTMMIPIQVEYSLFPKSETVVATAIAVRAGLLMPF